MTESFDKTLRAIVAEQVKTEVARAIAEATRLDEYLSTRAAAKLADVTIGTIRRWVDEKRLTRHRAGRHIRVSRLELERLLKSGGATNDEMTPEELAAQRFG